MVIEKNDDENSFEVDTTFEKSSDQVLNFLNDYGLLGLLERGRFQKFLWLVLFAQQNIYFID